MPKAQLTAEQIAHAHSVFAKGGFVPRRKGQRYAKELYSLCDFYSQQGVAHETVTQPAIAKVEFLGTFQGYGHYGNIQMYRAFAITAKDGSRWAGYSLDGDDYVLCQMPSYLAQ
jgi:hypothetical protein